MSKDHHHQHHHNHHNHHYHNHYHTRLTDFIRVNEPDMIDVGAEWSVFRDIVDKFLGDQHKQSFIDTMFATENNVSNMMICAGVQEHDVVNAITLGATSATFKAISSKKNQIKSKMFLQILRYIVMIRKKKKS